MIPIKPISQRNSKWSKKKLGFGVGTIGSYGCLLVSYTILLNYFGEKFTPDIVNEQMKVVGGYVGITKNLWVWREADELYGTHYEGSFAWNNSKVLEWIDKDIPVIVKVDGKPIGGLSHYVVAIGGGKIADPWTGKIENFSKYKPLGFHVYTYKKGGDKLSSPSIPIKIQTNSNNWKALMKGLNKTGLSVDEVLDIYRAVSSQASELTKLKKNEINLIDKLETAGDLVIKAEELREKWHGLYKQSQKNLESCKLDCTTFQQKITKMKETSILTASSRELFLGWLSSLWKAKKAG